MKGPASTLWSAESGLPALVLNATELNSGRTVASSPFRLQNGSANSSETTGFPEKDATFREILAAAPQNATLYKPLDKCSDNLVEIKNTDVFKNDRDLSLIQAAVLSARFPYASPAGSIERLTSSTECPETTGESGQVFAAETQYIDGGYVESSGTEQALKIVKKLQEYSENRCEGLGEASDETVRWCDLKIHLIAINLRTTAMISDASYGLVLTPPLGLVKTWSQRSQSSKEEAVEYFGSDIKLKNVGEFHPIEPFDEFNEIPLGWRLSQQTSKKLSELICTGEPAKEMSELLKLVTDESSITLSCEKS